MFPREPWGLRKFRKAQAGTTTQGQAETESGVPTLGPFLPALTTDHTTTPVHPLWHLAVAVDAAPWTVTRGEAVDLAFVTGFRCKQLLIWAVLGSRAEAEAGDAVPRPGQGGGRSSGKRW